jgi:spore maturation protein CgeB
LTEKAKGLEEIFVIGEEVEAFGDAAELQDKAAFYLKNDSAREKIARKGYEKVQRVWTWDQRVQEMIRYLGVESPSR